jgi:hypothetical protein
MEYIGIEQPRVGASLGYANLQEGAQRLPSCKYFLRYRERTFMIGGAARFDES